MTEKPEVHYRALKRLSLRSGKGWIVFEAGEVFVPPKGMKLNPAKVEKVDG